MDRVISMDLANFIDMHEADSIRVKDIIKNPSKALFDKITTYPSYFVNLASTIQ